MFFDFIFYFSALSVIPFWFLMIFFPNNKLTIKLISSPWIILPPTLCYLYFLLPNLVQAFSWFNDINPNSMANYMSNKWAASLFWAYAGAFDLFVGRWIFFDSKEKRFNPFFISPILFISIFFGPLGFLLYFILSFFAKIDKNHNSL